MISTMASLSVPLRERLVNTYTIRWNEVCSLMFVEVPDEPIDKHPSVGLGCESLRFLIWLCDPLHTAPDFVETLLGHFVLRQRIGGP
jgi:hypothetical protein